MKNKLLNWQAYLKNVESEEWKNRLGIIFELKDKKDEEVLKKASFTFSHIDFFVFGVIPTFQQANVTYLSGTRYEDYLKKSSIFMSKDLDSISAAKAGFSGLDLVSSEKQMLKSIAQWDDKTILQRVNNFEKYKENIDK